MAVTEEDAGYTLNRGYHEFVENIFSLPECIVSSISGNPQGDGVSRLRGSDGKLHGVQNAYLIRSDKTLMFDTWSSASADVVLEKISEVLDGDELDYLVPSHPESNHAGNTWVIMNEYPDATLVAPNRGVHHELYGYDDATIYVNDGDTIDLGDKVVEFWEPTFFDHATTTYLFEHSTRTLFTSDWFGFFHTDSECLKCVDELEYEVSASQFERFAGYAFVWLRFADPEKTDIAIDRLIEQTSPNIIAPAHGQVFRDDIPKYVDLVKSVTRKITESGDDTHIHKHQMNRYGGEL